MVLGQVDLEKLVEKHLNSVQDWERNFKALKARGKESERLPRYIPYVKSTVIQVIQLHKRKNVVNVLAFCEMHTNTAKQWGKTTK